MPNTEPIGTFTRKHPTTGEKQERDAYTPGEVVSLRADGWVVKPAKAPTKSTPPAAAAK